MVCGRNCLVNSANQHKCTKYISRTFQISPSKWRSFDHLEIQILLELDLNFCTSTNVLTSLDDYNFSYQYWATITYNGKHQCGKMKSFIKIPTVTSMFWVLCTKNCILIWFCLFLSLDFLDHWCLLCVIVCETLTNNYDSRQYMWQDSRLISKCSSCRQKLSQFQWELFSRLRSDLNLRKSSALAPKLPYWWIKQYCHNKLTSIEIGMSRQSFAIILLQR